MRVETKRLENGSKEERIYDQHDKLWSIRLTSADGAWVSESIQQAISARVFEENLYKETEKAAMR